MPHIRSLLLAVPLILTGPPAHSAHTVAAVFAHPDDELLVAPLLATLARQGVSVTLIVATAGESGTLRTEVPAGVELATIRRAETQCSARALGLASPIILDFADGQLGHFERPAPAYTQRLASTLAEVLTRLHPEAIVTFGPEGADGHPDHRIISSVVTQLVQARTPGVPSALLYAGFPSTGAPLDLGSGTPWMPTDTAFMPVRIAYAEADIAATRQAMGCYVSQIPPTDIEPSIRWYESAFHGTVYLRQWFGTAPGDDLFSLRWRR